MPLHGEKLETRNQKLEIGKEKTLLAGLRAAKHAAFEFAFGLEPIVHIMAWLFAAFEIDFVGAKSDFFITRRVPC